MKSRVIKTLACLTLALALLGTNALGAHVAADSSLLEGAFGVAVNPSSVLVKVGETAKVNITVTGAGDVGPVCFSLVGFPETGFRTSFDPGCATPQAGIVSVLSVEATPAAAPQSFTAQVIATITSQSAQTSLTITVEPAMPAWIPWLGLGLFFLILGLAVFWRPKLPFRKAKRPSNERKRRSSRFQ